MAAVVSSPLGRLWGLLPCLFPSPQHAEFFLASNFHSPGATLPFWLLLKVLETLLSLIAVASPALSYLCACGHEWLLDALQGTRHGHWGCVTVSLGTHPAQVHAGATLSLLGVKWEKLWLKNGRRCSSVQLAFCPLSLRCCPSWLCVFGASPQPCSYQSWETYLVFPANVSFRSCLYIQCLNISLFSSSSFPSEGDQRGYMQK